MKAGKTNSPISMLTHDLATKQRLLQECKRKLNVQVQAAKEAMENAQQSAKESEGGMEDLRESCQTQREMYARQLDELQAVMVLLQGINATKVNREVSPGAVVRTELQSYFIGISLCEVKVDGEPYFAVSALSPLYKAMAGKTQGQTFSFRDREYSILQVY
jgi:transcription elongation GreA/GreB family factor